MLTPIFAFADCSLHCLNLASIMACLYYLASSDDKYIVLVLKYGKIICLLWTIVVILLIPLIIF